MQYKTLFLAAALLCSAGALAWVSTARVASELRRERPDLPLAAQGALAFYGDDFGGLSRSTLATNAVPWRLTAAALVLAARDAGPETPVDGAALQHVLSGFGFLFPDAIGNWPEGVERPRSALPLGMTFAQLQVVPGLPIAVANLGCASCHAGTTYAADGSPSPSTAWMGLPNTSLDLEAYTDAVYRAYVATVDRPDALMATAATLFPEMDARERWALRRLVLPRVRARLSDLEATGRATPFPNGSPGNTNGVAALKQALGVPMADGGQGETGFTSIPDLGHRTWRTSLLYDGVYAVPGQPRRYLMTAADVTDQHRDRLAAITSFFTVPSMGVRPGAATGSLERARLVLRFVHDYRPPRFPGPIDAALAGRGADIYARACAGCHGDYAPTPAGPQLVRFPNWLGDVGTDPARARAFGSALIRAVGETRYRNWIAAAATGQYVAPPLTGIWATAPYLHNGSVPTVAALLDPATRPNRFLVGGHRLDFGALGIALAPDGNYPRGYRPWSTPVATDVAAPGLSNRGHGFGGDLSAPEKSALIEYLKQL